MWYGAGDGTFWLILVAFRFGVLRVPVAVLQVTGVLAAHAPAWYVLVTRPVLRLALHFHLPGAQPPGWASNSGANGRASNMTDTDAILPSRTWYHSQVRELGTGAVLRS